MKCNRIKRALIRKTEPNPVANPCGPQYEHYVCVFLSVFFMARHRVLFSLCFHNRVQIRHKHGNGQMDIKNGNENVLACATARPKVIHQL